MEQYSRQPLVYPHHSLTTEGTEHPSSLGVMGVCLSPIWFGWRLCWKTSGNHAGKSEKICEKNKTPDCSGVYLVAPSGIDPLT